MNKSSVLIRQFRKFRTEESPFLFTQELLACHLSWENCQKYKQKKRTSYSLVAVNAVNHTMWVLGTIAETSARAARILNHSSISQAPEMTFVLNLKHVSRSVLWPTLGRVFSRRRNKNSENTQEEVLDAKCLVPHSFASNTPGNVYQIKQVWNQSRINVKLSQKFIPKTISFSCNSDFVNSICLSCLETLARGNDNNYSYFLPQILYF